MNEGLLSRRQAALDRHDAAIARWPQREGTGFVAEMKSIASELALIAAAFEARQSSALECSRCWRYVADAFFDLGRSSERGPLQDASAALARAESWMRDVEAPRDRAVLDFNTANVLRGLSDGTARALMDEAMLRYRLALRGFERLGLPHASNARTAIATLQAQLSLLDAFDRVRGVLDDLSHAQDALEARPDDPEAQRLARAALDAAQARRVGVVQGARAAVEQASQSLPGADFAPLFAQVESLMAGDGRWSPLIAMLRERLAAEVQAGRVKPARRGKLEGLLANLSAVMSEPDDSLLDSARQLARLRQLMRETTQTLARPSVAPEPPAGGRGQQLADLAGGLSMMLAADAVLGGAGPAEREQGGRLFKELAQWRGGKSPFTADGEREHLHPLARRIDEHLRRSHLSLARPIWPLAGRPVDPSGLHVCGSTLIEPLLRRCLKTLPLNRVTPPSNLEIAQARAQALWSSRVVLADLRLSDPVQKGAACYELGIARAFGKCIVVVVAPGSTLPFDIEIAPLEIEPGASADDADERSVAALTAALDEALLTVRLAQHEGSAAATAAELARLCAGRPGMPLLLAGLDRERPDAIDLRRVAEAALGLLGDEAPLMLLPAWPARYPAPGEKRLFHVMPFKGGWPDEVRTTAAAACRNTGTQYVRGDEAEDNRIIRSIWDEIGAGSHVLVDLTGLNANVALELGMAHALGRRCLVVMQGTEPARLFPMIEKWRVAGYRLGAAPKDRFALGPLVERFTQGGGAAD